MEIKPTFEVNIEGTEIIFKQVVEKRMSMQESMSEINIMKSEVDKLNQQLESMTKAKEDDILSKDIEKLSNQLDSLNVAYAKWDDILKPQMEQINKEVRRRVKKRKIKSGYDRIKDVNAKIVKQNELLAPICESEGIDINHPIIRKIKMEFDRI